MNRHDNDGKGKIRGHHLRFQGDDARPENGAALRHSVSSFIGGDPVGAMHRQAHQHGHAGPFRTFPGTGRPRRRLGRRGFRLHKERDLPQQQDALHHQGRPDTDRGIRRRDAHRHRQPDEASRRRPQDSQRNARRGMEQGRHGCGHARVPRKQPPRPHQQLQDAA